MITTEDERTLSIIEEQRMRLGKARGELVRLVKARDTAQDQVDNMQTRVDELTATVENQIAILKGRGRT